MQKEILLSDLFTFTGLFIFIYGINVPLFCLELNVISRFFIPAKFVISKYGTNDRLLVFVVDYVNSLF